MTTTNWTADILAEIEADRSDRQRVAAERAKERTRRDIADAERRRAFRKTPEYRAQQQAEADGRRAEREAPFDSKNDPFLEPDWTVAQALAWVIWRSAADVRRFSRQTICAGERQGEGVTFKPGRRPGDVWDDAARAENLHTGGSDGLLMSGSEARDQLWRELKGGSVHAHGIPVGLASRMLIPAHEWRDIDLLMNDHLDEADAFGKFNALAPSYRSVRLRREPVLTTWQKVKPTQGRRGRKASLDHEVLKRIVFDLMDINGNLTQDDPEWDTQEKLLIAVRKATGSPLEKTAFRQAVVPHLKAWQAWKLGN